MSPKAVKAALLEMLDKAEAEAANVSELSPPPPLSIGVRLEQWRGRLNNALALFAYAVCIVWLYGGLRF